MFVLTGTIRLLLHAVEIDYPASCALRVKNVIEDHLWCMDGLQARQLVRAVGYGRGGNDGEGELYTG